MFSVIYILYCTCSFYLSHPAIIKWIRLIDIDLLAACVQAIRYSLQLHFAYTNKLPINLFGLQFNVFSGITEVHPQILRPNTVSTHSSRTTHYHTSVCVLPTMHLNDFTLNNELTTLHYLLLSLN